MTELLASSASLNLDCLGAPIPIEASTPALYAYAGVTELPIDLNLEDNEDGPPLTATDGVEAVNSYPLSPDVEAPVEPSRWRRMITFVVIAALLILFTLIVFTGLIQSVWWY